MKKRWITAAIRIAAIMAALAVMTLPAVAGPADRAAPAISTAIGYPVPITLQWEPLADPAIRGYRVYYGHTDPPANMIYFGPQTSLDLTVYAGKTYYFAIQSVDTSGNADPISDVLEWYAVPMPTQGIYIERKVRKLWLTY